MTFYDRIKTISVLTAALMLIIVFVDVFLAEMNLIGLFIESAWLQLLIFTIMWFLAPYVFSRTDGKKTRRIVLK